MKAANSITYDRSILLMSKTVLAMMVICMTFSQRADAAGKPLDPLTPPFYAFDSQSPTALRGDVAPCDVLFKEFPNPAPPSVLVSCQQLQMGQPGDEIDALSTSNETVASTASIILLFSVDRNSVGSVPPDAALFANRVPYNVQDQALKNQASGDQFMSLQLFSRQGQLPGNRAGNNNTQTYNNYNQGGTDFNAEPPVGSASAARRASQDNVIAMVRSSADQLNLPISGVYYSLIANSPAMQNIPGAAPSGANIYIHPDPTDIAIAPRVFASSADLGLVPTDDINSMIVFDENANGLFDGTDQVIFSLTPGSPSLGTLDVGIAGSPADVYSVTAGAAPTATMIASAAALGLAAATDNIDALDYSPCTDVDFCAEQHGIRTDEAPAVSQWGLAVLALVILCAGTVLSTRRKRHLS